MKNGGCTWKLYTLHEGVYKTHYFSPPFPITSFLILVGSAICDTVYGFWGVKVIEKLDVVQCYSEQAWANDVSKLYPFEHFYNKPITL